MVGRREGNGKCIKPNVDTYVTSGDTHVIFSSMDHGNR